VSLSTTPPQEPETGHALPLTRREIRERERAAEQRREVAEIRPAQQEPEKWVDAHPATIEIQVALPSRRELRAQEAAAERARQPDEVSDNRLTASGVAPIPGHGSGSPGAAAATPADTALRARRSRGSAVKSKRVRVSPAALAPSRPPRRRARAVASKSLSFFAMLFVGAILVGVSVPSNAFLEVGSMATAAVASEAELTALHDDSRLTQSLAVPDGVVSDVTPQDDIEVISYAEVLALKYAGVEYEYDATQGAIRWPFPYSVPITDGYGDRIGGFHKGTDFAAPSGTPIYSIADGVVTYIQADWSGYGYHAVISHTINGQQVESLYAHMITDSSPLVVGDRISVGDFVGLVGETGIAYGAHLHFEVHLDEVPVDPFAWLTTNAI